jgi:Conjugative relaxosome accessory transposon protein
MRKVLIAFTLILANMLCMVTAARAESVTAGNIFGMFGGTTTIDQGGSLHSQARSIYSLGGGMTSFQGKRVSLLAVDPPSFSAGCSGISWHFGGFAFISVDEIRQLVEAVAQASLGVAVDLAMQTLCPQCYAVMAKLRDIANQMRNAAADACKVAQNFGALLKDKGIFTPGGSNAKCAESGAAKGESASWLDSIAAGGCKLLTDAEAAVKKTGDDVTNWLGGGATSTGKTPSKDQVQAIGNQTYRALDALGYKDGVAKDLMMSYLGMTIVVPPDTDCKSAFTYLQGTSSTSGTPTDTEKKLLEVGATLMGEIKPTSDTTKPDVAQAAQKAATAEGTGATRGPQVCYVPPMITGLEQIGISLVCGFDPKADSERFAAKFHGGGGTSATPIARLSSTALGELCNVTATSGTGNPKVGIHVENFTNPLILTCRKGPDKECMRPRTQNVATLVGETGSGEYTGLAWYILDSLYTGVDRVREGKEALPPETIAVLNGSGYPLYRLINLAAVYPGMADELLQAYGGIIAVQYVLDTLEKISRIGSQPAIHTAPSGGVAPGEIAQMREEINQMSIRTGTMKNQVLRRMNEKRALVDSIVQVNRAVQAEVISRGLGDNNNMAISLKKQIAKPAAPPVKE